MSLRVPALVSAFSMFAMGLTFLYRAHELDLPVREPVGRASASAVTLRLRARLAPVVTETATSSGERTLPVFLMGLAIWLGLANLIAHGVPPLLTLLSAVSAFMLFAMGWLLFRPGED